MSKKEAKAKKVILPTKKRPNKKREFRVSKSTLDFINKLAKEHQQTAEKLKQMYLPQFEQMIEAIKKSGISDQIENMKKIQKEFIGNNKTEHYITAPINRTVSKALTKEEIKIVVEDVFKEFSKKQKIPKGRQTTLYITKQGKICRDISSKNFYEMQHDGLPMKIINYLIKNNTDGYELTELICKMCDAKSEESVRATIHKLNRNIKNKLKLKETFIEGKRNSGYRINPHFYIEIVN